VVAVATAAPAAAVAVAAGATKALHLKSRPAAGRDLSLPSLGQREPRMSDYEFTMSLRIRHPNVDPAQVTRTLGISPQHTWRAGDTRRDSEGSALYGEYRETFWMGGLMAQPKLASERTGVESELTKILAQLRKSQDFLESLKEQGGVAELHVSIFAREEFRLEFLPDSLALLGRLGLTVAVEVKPHPGGTPATAAS
jgi:hypothetical protein